MRRLASGVFAALMATTSIAQTAPSQPAAATPVSAQGRLADGASWSATMPAQWNGTVLLWSHGYSPRVGSPEDAPAAHREALLRAGYALVGSSYAKPGWALEEAVPDQFATLDAFAARYGKPKRTIAWGMSMGGLVTSALAETAPRRIDGALAMCSSIGGAVGMMNMALDGAYAFRTLVAPDAGIELTGIRDDRANSAKVNAAITTAQATAPGRARIALAGVLAGLPGWTDAKVIPPAAADAAGQEAQMAQSFAMGVFLPRQDQEARAGGVFSWNDGVDYRAQLALSGRRDMVATLYRDAGLDLDADLARLNAGQRVKALPAASAYMTQHYTPNARPLVPLLAVQNVGDGLTSPSLQRAYAETAARTTPGRVQSLWVQAAGHCGFATPTVLASLDVLNAKLATNRWPTAPAGFVAHVPPPMLRPCVRGAKACR